MVADILQCTRQPLHSPAKNHLVPNGHRVEAEKSLLWSERRALGREEGALVFILSYLSKA